MYTSTWSIFLNSQLSERPNFWAEVLLGPHLNHGSPLYTTPKVHPYSGLFRASYLLKAS